MGGSSRFSPQNKEGSGSIPRTYSSPMNIESSYVVLDRPMRLSEIQVASEHALKKTLSNPNLWMSLSSKQNFEVGVFYFLKLGKSNFVKWKKRYIKFGPCIQNPNTFCMVIPKSYMS